MSTPTPFAQPGASNGDQFDAKEFLGALLLIYPKAYDPSVPTVHGPSSAADVDVIVVDRQDPTTGQPVIKRNAKLFGNLANSVRDSVGKQVLGRLGQTPTNKGNPAWVLNSFTEADAAAAAPVHTAWVAGQFQPPAQAQSAVQQPTPQGQWANPGFPPAQQNQAPPGPDPWAGVNAAPAPQHQQWGAVPAATAAPVAGPGAPAAAPNDASDPLVAFLLSKGLAPQQVAAMDVPTRQAIAATY